MADDWKIAKDRMLTLQHIVNRNGNDDEDNGGSEETESPEKLCKSHVAKRSHDIITWKVSG